VEQLEGKLSKQEEVLAKRHADINTWMKENTMLKNQLDDIFKTYGDLNDIN
jgi:hypothetical protein